MQISFFHVVLCNRLLFITNFVKFVLLVQNSV